MTLRSETFLILLGGDLSVTERLKNSIAGARVIAADGGMRHAPALSVTPELWVGDFDSVTPELVSRFAQVERRPFPPAKNETDCEIAVNHALQAGGRNLILAGALGGERTDHAFSHLTYALALMQSGLEIRLTSGDEEAYPLAHGPRIYDLPKNSLFSILGLSELKGLTIEGARYPLDRFDAPFGATRTISNVAEGPVTVSLENGLAVLLARPYDFSGA
jgi:thiamine pyrophosphokinase